MKLAEHQDMLPRVPLARWIPNGLFNTGVPIPVSPCSAAMVSLEERDLLAVAGLAPPHQGEGQEMLCCAAVSAGLSSFSSNTLSFSYKADLAALKTHFLGAPPFPGGYPGERE